MSQIVESIYQMLGPIIEEIDDQNPENRVEMIFSHLDIVRLLFTHNTYYRFLYLEQRRQTING